jgi:tRNA (mo5U34)-methyltransferase
MEKRGAEETVAIDILDPTQWDWPVNSTDAALEALAARKGQGEGFEVARQALASSVKRLELSVYDLDPEAVGRFDFVYVGSILLHLRDPVRAIERVASVCAGEALFVDAIDLPLTLAAGGRPAAVLDGRGRPWWWRPNVAGFVRMIEAGGFTPVTKPKRFLMPPGPGLPPFTPHGRDLLRGRSLGEAFMTRQGDPHAAVRARPTVG